MEKHIKLMMAWVMPKHVFKKLYRELEIFANTVIVTKLWQCYIWTNYYNKLLSPLMIIALHLRYKTKKQLGFKL